MKSSKTTAIVIACVLPLLIIIGAIVATFLPSQIVSPAHDFLYTVSGGPYGYYSSSLQVENGKLIKEAYQYPKTDPAYPVVEPSLYIYHVATGISERVSYESIASSQFKIQPGTSSDGYEVINGQGPNDVFGFLFGGYDRSGNGVVIKSKFFSKKISLARDPSTGYYPQILGWLE